MTGTGRTSLAEQVARTVVPVTNATDVREFLESRRARITPAQAGLRDYGGTRRVPGLRRTEVALLAGISVEYYTRLERGALGGASESVLDALSRALQLDDAERAHLFDLARTSSSGSPRQRRRSQPQLRPSIQRLLDAMTGAPAFVRNGRLDVVAANELGRALYAPMYDNPARPVNHARFVFLDPASHDFWVDWDRAAFDTVAILRQEAGRDPYDRQLTDLVGELSTRSDQFRTLWAEHNVRLHRSGTKTFNHPAVGVIELTFDQLDLPADSGLSLLAYSAEPGSRSQEAIALLATWAATTRQDSAVAADTAS